PRAIWDHGAPVSLPKLKKAYEKGTRGISWGPLLTPGPRAMPECSNGQSAPASAVYFQFLRMAYPIVPHCLQVVIPILTPPPETPPLSTSVSQKAGS
ncbi:unnamed protein product, partial [Staurois parvus]